MVQKQKFVNLQFLKFGVWELGFYQVSQTSIHYLLLRIPFLTPETWQQIY